MEVIAYLDDPADNINLNNVGLDEEPPFLIDDDDNKNIPTTNIIDHVTNGKHSSNYLEMDVFGVV